MGSLRGEPYGIDEYIGDDKKETAYFDKVNMMCSIYPERYSEKPAEEEKSGLFARIKGLFKKKENVDAENAKTEQGDENREKKTDDVGEKDL